MMGCRANEVGIMDCEHCTEFLADFLLDELPEAEAVLIQEHLNICAGCMRTYRELKGTGKALEAVPALRSIKGTPEFTRVVRAEAAVESAKIIEALPAEKRSRVEARRAARLSKFASAPAANRSRARACGRWCWRSPWARRRCA
jgi:predicted anti-sigma-YlaC factor YlaD